MGSIYRVRHRLLDEIRVVKVLRPQVVEDAEMKSRFLEEAKTATRLKHPNICAHYDFALDEEGVAYLVMEYIDGANLSDLMRSRGRPGLSLALEIVHQSLLALGYLHRKGVIHRDIAPDNLMLTHDEQGGPVVKLIDLGIAKALNRDTEMTAAGVFLGKLKYASPEQYGKLPAGEKLDGRSDLYSLGIVLYELLTGVRPFAGETPPELLQAHLFQPPLPFPESDPEGRVPEEVRAAVLKALEKKREDRFASAEEFDREIVMLRRRFVGPEDLEGTVEILSSIPMKDGALPGGVTPSAQDRLDRQFGAHGHKTPSPTPSSVTLSPTVASQPPPGARELPAAAPRPAPSAARTAAAASGTTSGRRWAAALPTITVAALLLGALSWWRPWRSRSSSGENPPASLPTPSSASALQSGATAPPAATAAPSAEPTAQPAGETLAEPATVPSAREKDVSGLRRTAENARVAASRARQQALRARAPELAAALYDVAARKEKEAERSFADGELRRATASFQEAAADFNGATTWIANHRRDRSVPAERVAVLSEPTLAPQPPVRAEPTTAAATPVPTPEPARAATVPPTEALHGAAKEPERIRAVLRDYKRAQDTLDVDLYARLFPSVTPQQRQNLERAWQALAKQQVELEIRQIDVKNSHAVVRAFQRLVATPRIGSELRDARERIFRLEKRGDSWVIAGVD